ncbi:MAG: UDP-N-acetylglucosamine diphosphorylase/glucosamine-1-phosphate N-acetyltransferase [Gammaproteobacteria bacterium]|nr:MAG: UDP-N-acetylglucosamine diphosphorylase/glucosamine-1-phosphate N-acetyltransferase [Gammaproteobacteria bacterium]
MSSLEVIILAAGQGSRMKSALPKVLHPIGGKPMLAHVLSAARALAAKRIHVVVGHGAEQVKQALADEPVQWVLQAQQLGTGHAVAQAMPGVATDARVLVLYGDVPLVPVAALEALLAKAGQQALALLTAMPENPTGYGRIVRNHDGQVMAIVEHKDADEQQRQIREVNTGILTARASDLARWLPALKNHNQQQEYYLTDTIAMAVREHIPVVAAITERAMEVQGVNDRKQQAEQERAYQRQQAERLMQAGVTLMDPDRIDIRGTVTAGKDVIIDANVIFEGTVELGDSVHIGANCIIKDARLANGVTVHPNSMIEESELGEAVNVGPFARLRPGTRLAKGVRIGNFVETKNAVFAENSKANHLSYIGDASVGADSNIGAGTITCNYDGARKSKTVIGDGAFIGSNTALVAPVTVGNQATIGAGSTITKNVEDGQLAIGRGKQRNIDGWQRPQKPEQE